MLLISPVEIRQSGCAHRFQGRRGVAAVELAVLLPFLCFAFVLAVDFSRVFYYCVTLDNGARNGAVCGAADTAHALDQATIKNIVLADFPNLDPQKVGVDITTDNAAAPTYVQVTVTYPFETVTNYPGVPTPITLTRTVRVRVTPAVPRF